MVIQIVNSFGLLFYEQAPGGKQPSHVDSLDVNPLRIVYYTPEIVKLWSIHRWKIILFEWGKTPQLFHVLLQVFKSSHFFIYSVWADVYSKSNGVWKLHHVKDVFVRRCCR